MQASNLAAKIKKAFANVGTKNTIPENASPTAGAASYETGFPPLTMTPIAAGGVPPFGADFNGILFELSKAIQSQQAVGLTPWDSDFTTAIGGYPKNSFVSHLNVTWKSLIENNTVEPSTDPAKWIKWGYTEDEILAIAASNQAGDYVFAANGIPPSYALVCDGAAVSRTAYSDLFTKIGTDFGVGDGTTTFNVPNVPLDYTLVNGNGSIALVDGVVKGHDHPQPTNYVSTSVSGFHIGHNYHSGDSNTTPAGMSTAATGSTGGSANFAAGRRALICIRFK